MSDDLPAPRASHRTDTPTHTHTNTKPPLSGGYCLSLNLFTAVQARVWVAPTECVTCQSSGLPHLIQLNWHSAAIFPRRVGCILQRSLRDYLHTYTLTHTHSHTHTYTHSHSHTYTQGCVLGRYRACTPCTRNKHFEFLRITSGTHHFVGIRSKMVPKPIKNTFHKNSNNKKVNRL